MTTRARQPAPVPPTLADQKTDFTAEGSPPPGKVATTPPLTPLARLAPLAHLAHPPVIPKPSLKPGPKHKASKATKNKQAG